MRSGSNQVDVPRVRSSPRRLPLGFQERVARALGNGFALPRMDRLATVYLTHPIRRLISRKGSRRIPVLMYHSVSENLFGKSHAYYQINTRPAVFAQQMRWLKEGGYQTLTVSQLHSAMEERNIPPKTVVITFDDGYRDFITDAFPHMRIHGFIGTVFLATNRIQDSPARIEGVDYMTWHEVREYHEHGVEFGSHTVTHPDLRSLGPEEIDYEVCYSKEAIEDQLGCAVRSFAYPFAFPEEDRSFIRFLEDVLKRHGFETAVSTILGRVHENDTRFFLPRLPVNSWDDHALFHAKLEGSYDWVHWPQWLHKFIHHNVALMQRPSSVEAD